MAKKSKKPKFQSVLADIGIFGWEKIENSIIGGFIAQVPQLWVGNAGTGKTFAFERIGWALNRAYMQKGYATGYPFAYRNAATANVENMIGYPLPPPMQTMQEMIENGEQPTMLFVYDPDTIAGSKMLGVDEINRCNPMTQNRWFSVINERRVDGVTLPLEVVVGMMNPPGEYEGTELLDRAFADRFAALIEAPNYWEMDEKDRLRVAGSRLQKGVAGVFKNESVNYGDKIEDETCARLLDVIEEGRNQFKLLKTKYGPQVTRYTDAMIMYICKSMGSASVTQGKPDGRRAAMITEMILATHAAAKVLGDGDLKRDALSAFQRAMMNKVVGDRDIQEQVLITAHQAAESLLSSPEEAIRIRIQSENDIIKRIVIAFNENAPSDIVTETIHEAHKTLKKADEISSMIFSYALFSKIQDLSAEKQQLVDKFAIDEIGADVYQVLKSASKFSITGLDVDPGRSSSTDLMDLLARITELSKTSIGRATLAISSYYMDRTANVPKKSSVFNIGEDSRLEGVYTDYLLRVNSVQNLLAQNLSILEEIE